MRVRALPPLVPFARTITISVYGNTIRYGNNSKVNRREYPSLVFVWGKDSSLEGCGYCYFTHFIQPSDASVLISIHGPCISQV